jgi:SAM-dependent methyltransferase
MYDRNAIRGLFEQWGHEGIEGDPGETTSRWSVPLINHIILDRWLPREGNVLDAGCGHGVESVRMARRGLSVTAVDISTSLLQHARQRAEKAGLLDRITFAQADISEPLPLPKDSFDVCIALTGVISHTGDRHRDALANLVACAKPGGLIILGVDSYYGKIREYMSTGRIDDAEHVADTRFTHTVSDTFEDYCFTPQELVDILDALNCGTVAMFTAPTIGAYGYLEASDDVLWRALALEQRFLGTPELLGAGEQLIAIFEKSIRQL